MATKDYPDILGYVTGGGRASFNGVQAALTVSPRVVRAGRPFRVLLLAQNLTDGGLELGATLHLPGRDARRQKDRFVAVSNPAAIRLRPGEAGYLALPATCHPDTAAGDDYRLGVAVSARPDAKSRVVRSEAGGDASDLSEKRRDVLDKLRQLEFTATKRPGRRDELEAPFRVLAGGRPDDTPVKSGWVSLWNLGEDGSNHALLERYGSLVEKQVLPKLKKEHIFEPLRQTTDARFRAAGYPLKPLETLFIAKLLALIVHMAAPGEDQVDHLGSQAFHVAVLFRHKLPDDVALPRWFEGLLRGVAFNEQVPDNPAAFVCAKLYDALLLDAVPFAFNMIRTVTGEDMGSEEEIRRYARSLVRRLKASGGMDFAHAYLPLVMGGTIIFDRVIAPGEKLEDTLRGMSDVLAMRDAEWTEDNDLVFLMTKE
ncbi:MAG TPA: hypothetical protein VKY59_05825, partial [Spirillospora sp.]|nr:hypothetical protein [Spirillospora sp.]